MSIQKWILIAVWAIFGGTVVFSLKSCIDSTEAQATTDHSTSAAARFVNNKFPDFGQMISPKDFSEQYPGEEVFKLKQDYPLDMPPDSEIPPFFDIPFDEGDQWMDYAKAVRDYCFEGMIEVDFDANKNEKRQWYHMPWMHWGDQATEGFNGLAKEAQISPLQLTPEQTDAHQVYALGFYNSFAGYTLAQMWQDPINPNPAATQAPEGGFPVGTVIFKLLFTDADESQVDYLTNPFVWNGYVTRTWSDSVRVVKPMQLIQMDFMVRDPRADQYGTGWVFGTYCYNGKLNEGKTGAARAENLVPVGIQWGNDPQDTTNFINPYPPLRTIINPNLQQTRINPDSTQLPPQHLGWGGRLDGPVDLNTASCMSCHATAEFPQIGALVPAEAFIGIKNKNGVMVKLTETDAPEWKKYYTNLRCGTPYDSEATSCDFSLQVSLALEYFYQWKSQDEAGQWYHDFLQADRPIHRGASEHLKALNMK
ncbi:hypothetical protein [Flavilitoribacter nigricans]|uniref:Cytochrome c domain-containing protein n=1 Tax=Flavilitoribacter nigricans (strain ATCC 23147 / DSM 23189 / NBRC 102662 / NCIMB 1420 / SS-2) TaxID=1122177 RepID=A0A2D0N5J5_FLAN2|nr:hypothetical protein [Flavilitoribacter nigricans]PHN03656.1 hypothetical protein CRP01_25740 [Flavilitoribacter nigricans DSM 23189 = NBRC 102662]